MTYRGCACDCIGELSPISGATNNNWQMSSRAFHLPGCRLAGRAILTISLTLGQLFVSVAGADFQSLDFD